MHFALLFQPLVNQETMTSDLVGHSANWHHATASWQYDVTHIIFTEGAGNDLQQGCTTCGPAGYVTRDQRPYFYANHVDTMKTTQIYPFLLVFRRAVREPAQNNGCGPLPEEVGYPWFAEKWLHQPERTLQTLHTECTIQHVCIASLPWNKNRCYVNYRMSVAWNAKQKVKKPKQPSNWQRVSKWKHSLYAHLWTHLGDRNHRLALL